MTIRELAEKSRSYRKYDNSVKIPREELLSFIDAARFAPSSVNYQPLKYYISCDDATNAKIRPNTYWARLLPDYDGPHGDDNPSAYIIILFDRELQSNADRFDKDVGINAQTILLAAVEAGYGGIMIGNIDRDKLRKALAIDERYDIRLVLAVGKPAEDIILEELKPGQSAAYYRDAEDRHHVPKRTLCEIVIN